jgi:hypothetical protein
MLIIRGETTIPLSRSDLHPKDGDTSGSRDREGDNFIIVMRKSYWVNVRVKLVVVLSDPLPDKIPQGNGK